MFALIALDLLNTCGIVGLKAPTEGIFGGIGRVDEVDLI